MQQAFQLLLTKRSQRLSRSQTADKANSANVPSYVILIQHSLSLQHRVNRNATPEDRENYARANVMTPEEISTRATCGLLFIRDAFYRLSQAHSGSLILLSLAGNLCCEDNENKTMLFQQHGVTVDAASDPFGWDQTVTASSGIVEQTNSNGIRILARLNNLKELFRAIDLAVLQIQAKRNMNVTRGSVRNEVDQIPIIIDSITPLIALHGAFRTMSFLEKMRQRHWSSETATMLSPIVAPVLKESVPPIHHRLFEDSVADAVVSLDGEKVNIVRKSYTSGKVTREEQPFLLHRISSSHYNISFTEQEPKGCFISQKFKEVDELSLTSNQLPLEGYKKKKEVVILRHEVDSEHHPSQRRPRIFMQDDDIEFQDLDDDEPDDDLDL